ncbi:hypothetical protein V8B97DRAFT_2016877 [Scleroderma yunnanense]
MSATPSTSSRYASPAPPTPSTTTTTAAASKPAPPKQKPVNVFSNDGSFLERFQRPKKEDEEKRKTEEALTRKRQFADRFVSYFLQTPRDARLTRTLYAQKNRGKRHLPPPDTSPAVTTIDAQESPAKKPKLDEAPLSESSYATCSVASYGYAFAANYQKEVRNQEGRILKDTGTGVRPLVK